jgi:hypothetical protein
MRDRASLLSLPYPESKSRPDQDQHPDNGREQPRALSSLGLGSRLRQLVKLRRALALADLDPAISNGEDHRWAERKILFERLVARQLEVCFGAELNLSVGCCW